MTADVDVIIAVHRPDRPVLRTVTSALEGNSIDIRFLVVAHNIAPEELHDYEALRDLGCVEFLSCSDPFPSAAAPRNLALAHCTAPWVSTLDSDDRHEPGALTHWVNTGDAAQADAVIPRHRRASGAIVRTPVRRPFRSVLHPVKDRLAYRVGHLGLTRLSAIQELSLHYKEQLTVGEDLFFSYPLWFSGRKVVADSGPAYVVDDAGDHISVGNPAEIELASLVLFLKSNTWQGLSASERLSVAVKFLRGQVISAVSSRNAEHLAASEEREAISRVIREIEAVAPRARRYLSLSDNAILNGILDNQVSASEIVKRAQKRRSSFMRPSGLLPWSWRYVFHREAPLRFAFASALRR